MAERRRSSARTRAEILRVTRDLLAEHDIQDVTMRDIGAAAGVDHALIHQYFGTKEQLVETILRAELEATAALAPPPGAPADFASLRAGIAHFLGDGRPYARLIARAELAGFAPERFLDPASGGPLRLMAQQLAAVQRRSGAPAEQLPDPDLVAAVLGATAFSLATLEPWLSAVLGLEPGELDARRDDVVDILLGLVVAASGVGSSGAPSRNGGGDGVTGSPPPPSTPVT